MISAELDLFFSTLFMLMFGHFLADFPLQGQYLSEAKDPKRSSGHVWPITMFGHCMIHAGFVFVITGSLILAMLQLISHFIIDWMKCVGRFGEGGKALRTDQLLHIVVMIFIALVYSFI